MIYSILFSFFFYYGDAKKKKNLLILLATYVFIVTQAVAVAVVRSRYGWNTKYVKATSKALLAITTRIFPSAESVCWPCVCVWVSAIQLWAVETHTNVKCVHTHTHTHVHRHSKRVEWEWECCVCVQCCRSAESRVVTDNMKLRSKLRCNRTALAPFTSTFKWRTRHTLHTKRYFVSQSSRHTLTTQLNVVALWRS